MYIITRSAITACTTAPCAAKPTVASVAKSGVIILASLVLIAISRIIRPVSHVPLTGPTILATRLICQALLGLRTK